MIGTVVGATAIVVLTACFPQDRIAFLGILALWGGISAFAATLLRNFASYSAALAGYTAAIIAADTLGTTGGRAVSACCATSGTPPCSFSPSTRSYSPR
jgi:uncharacterized membrane protein YccC